MISINVPQFVDAEIPQGAIDGVNSTFHLQFTPNPVASLMLYRNGLLLARGGDYLLTTPTISPGCVVTFAMNAIPERGDELFAFYRF